MFVRHAILILVVTSAMQVRAFMPRSVQTNRLTIMVPVVSASKTPEYVVQDGNEEESASQDIPRQRSDDEVSEIRLSPPNPVQEYAQTNQPAAPKEENQKPALQYAALPPGTVVQIQVGDMGLARKAWKKRRRSGSPLLVPCSVLNVDRASTVRWNLIYVLEKFGRSVGGRKAGVQLSLTGLAQRYRSHLKTSLTKQATALGFEDAKSLVQALFNERVQKSYGIEMMQDKDGELCLQAPVSRLRAQKRANRSPVLQISDDGKEDTIKHTGLVRTRREDGDNEENKLYHLLPLSAALRVNQKEDVDPGTIQSGSMHTAVVFDYDVAGDAGAPLITLTLNSAPRERLRFGSEGGQNKHAIKNPKYMLKNLKTGDGPLKGRVVRFVKGGALIDCEIGRRIGNRPDSDVVRVLGLLKFSEAVQEEAGSTTQMGWTNESDMADDDTDEEEWEEIFSFDDLELTEEEINDDDDDEDEEVVADLSTLFDFDTSEEGEEEEDITHMFQAEPDGSLTYTDPETGEVQQISMDSLEADIDSDEEEDGELDVFGRLDVDDKTEDDDDDVDGPVLCNTKGSKRNPISRIPSEMRSKRLHLGDEVDIFVRSIAKQSNQLFFTMRSSIKGKKPKDIKQESDREKKLGRLLKQVGGMGRIEQLHGRVLTGVVKATSHTGDWLYVEPQEDNLPVGIAFGDESSMRELAKGDRVRIQLDGIDEARGQLSMKVLDKLAP